MISVSYLKSKYDKKETIKMIDQSIADNIHVDLMDGIYVEGNNLEINEVLNDLKDTNKPLDIHLMVKNPEIYIEKLAMLRPYAITIHLNSTEDMMIPIDMIKEYNIKVGIAINPDEDINLIDEYLDIIDYVLIMSVYPGKGGQSFIKEVLSKVDYLKDKQVSIGIDGGVDDESIKLIREYPIDNIISGSFVCLSDDYNKQISILKENVN